MKFFSSRKTSSKNEPREWPESRNYFFSTFDLRNERRYFLGFNFPAFHDFFFLFSISLSSLTFGIRCGCSYNFIFRSKKVIGKYLYLGGVCSLPLELSLFLNHLFEVEDPKIDCDSGYSYCHDWSQKIRWNFNQCRFLVLIRILQYINTHNNSKRNDGDS